ncbi:MAG: response regulator [Vibrio sp.]|uniref:response regulator n=1 Tax=Vibrio TaxID=662 RepID=UPI001EB7D7E2|nr:response regulator [Vibrio sp.]NRB69240.1 response regulator [Vibrio sp.]
MFGQIQNVSQAGVLIADDSPLVIANLKMLLRESGFSDRLIYTAKNVGSIYKTLREISIDLFICDYRFGKVLTGKQIFEECRYHGLLRPQCAFVMLTSETNGEVVRSILEVEPDEYVLKPYSLYAFKKRILRVYRRKQVMSSLLLSAQQCDVSDLEETFSNALKCYPEYATHILRIQGDLYLSQRLKRQAIAHFQACRTKRNSQWATTGHAMALIEMGELNQAQSVLEQWIDDTGKQPSVVSDSIALCCLLRKDQRGAKQALAQALKFSKGNVPRILAYTRLCEIEDNLEEAMSGFALYRQQIANTHHNTLSSAIYALRLKLTVAKAQGCSISMSAQNELHKLMEVDLSESERLALTLVEVHIELHDSNYKVARIKLADLLKNYHQLDLSWLHYLLYLLYETDNYHWFDQVTNWVRNRVIDETPSLEACSLQLMLENQIERSRKRKSTLDRLLWQVDQYAFQSTEKAIGLCIEVFKSRRQCVQVANKLLLLLNREIPQKIGPEEVKKAIFDCQAAISYTSSLRKSERLDALKHLNLAKQKFNRTLSTV